MSPYRWLFASLAAALADVVLLVFSLIKHEPLAADPWINATLMFGPAVAIGAAIAASAVCVHIDRRAGEIRDMILAAHRSVTMHPSPDPTAVAARLDASDRDVAQLREELQSSVHFLMKRLPELGHTL